MREGERKEGQRVERTEERKKFERAREIHDVR